MPFTLRPYQINFIAELRGAIKQYKRVIGCAATGSGKSKVFISIAYSALSKGKTVLIISESIKIYEQISAEMPAININAGSAKMPILINRCHLAMSQTLTRRPNTIQQFSALGDGLLIIADEAHIGTHTSILKSMANAYLLGFTATPDYRSAKHLPELYKHCVVGAQPDELVNAGWLAPYRHFARVDANLDELVIKSGEFTEESQEFIFETKVVYDGLLKDLREQQYKKCLVFTASIKHCEDVYKRIIDAGLNVVRTHSKLTETEERKAMYDFKNGINICVNVGQLTRGFDYPQIDMIILQRATTSLPLYLQMMGRASRIAPNKNEWKVLDYGGNFKRHGLWGMEREWGKMWMKQKKKREGVAPVKYCPECFYLCHSSVAVCPNCGHVFMKTVKDVEEGKLIEITESYNKLKGKKISELSQAELAIYAKFTNKKNFAIRVAKWREQKDEGWLAVFGKAMGYKNAWAYFQTSHMDATPIEFTDIIIR